MNLILKKRFESRLQPIVPDWSQNNNSILSSYTHKKSPGIRANKTAKLNFKPSWALLLTFGCPQFVYQSLCIRASNNWHDMKNKIGLHYCWMKLCVILLFLMFSLSFSYWSHTMVPINGTAWFIMGVLLQAKNGEKQFWK
jgi:hypothetical protein